ncbi:MAG: ABC transporter permease [candidate division Zixibacteria bacterium]|jgi:phospholipid/cholesterol/gamma-HCH transport system permease protein|nr:ABC transporter permease [candidate division Zixibacteria bacterium]
MKNPFRVVGRKTTLFFEDVGGISILIKNIILGLPGSFKRFHLIVEQMLYMGVNSMPLILVTSIFTGGVASVQAAYMFSDYVPMRYLGTAVGKSVIMELGPVLTALVVAGRVGASIAAELGTMKVTEQIDALETLALDPVKYLVTPRFVSGIIMLPVLTVFSDFIAILGGLLVSVVFLNVSSYTFLNGLKLFFHMRDLWAGLLKAFVFGGIIALVGCYQGFKTEGGAEGVGRSTTRAVVLASVMILITDYILASFLFGT